MDLDKLIKEAYLLKNKEDNINKLYEMVETMLALQESGLLKEVEEEEQEDEVEEADPEITSQTIPIPDLESFQPQDATEPEEYANLEVKFKTRRFNLEYDPERPFSVFTADPKMDAWGTFLADKNAASKRLNLFIDSFNFNNENKKEIKKFYTKVFITKRGDPLKALAKHIKLVDQNDLNRFEDLEYEQQKELIFDIFKITRRVIEYESTNSVVQKMKQYWIKSATTALNNFKEKLNDRQKKLDFKNFANQKIQVQQTALLSDLNNPEKLLFSYNKFAANLEIDFDPNIVAPENYSSRGIDSPSIQSARLPTQLKDFNKIIEKVFGSESGSTEDIIKKRIKQFTEFSEQYTRTGNIDANLEKKSITKFISELLLLSLFNEMNKSFQREEGRYLFEYFLALLIGGKPVGPEGGAVDFELDGQKGSAKYLKTGEGATQAIKGFEKNIPVTYVVAQRASPTEESPRAQELLFVDISAFDVVMKDGEKFTYKSIDEAASGNLDIVEKKVKLDNALRDETYLGTITLATMSEGQYKGLRDILGEKLNDQENKAIQLKKQVLDTVTMIFDNLKEAETKARMYVSTGKEDDGMDAITKLDESKGQLKSLSGLSKGKYNTKGEYETLDDTQQSEENT